MNCFVIMPFAKEFDDVHASIKTNVEAVISSRGGKCFRLDEARPAGPITDRLLREIQVAAFCVADVTGNIPNVMWEVGCAMALGKPIILITQRISELPFDIKDLQGLEYDRTQISRTLGEPLKKIVLDTIQNLSTKKSTSDPIKERDELVGTLLEEIKSIKSMMGDVVKAWSPPQEDINKLKNNLFRLEGVWVNKKTNSYYYAKLVGDELVVPYCYSGNNEVTGVYYDWKIVGEHWFARFTWLRSDVSGFAFFKTDSIDQLSGAWWSDRGVIEIPNAPPPSEGRSLQWVRQKETKFTYWANKFLDEVQKTGFKSILKTKNIHAEN